jgi:hypothetical protein
MLRILLIRKTEGKQNFVQARLQAASPFSVRTPFNLGRITSVTLAFSNPSLK